MIERINKEYVGYCDICNEETDAFDNWHDCKDWIKENWSMQFDERRQEWQHLCPNCKNLK